MTTVLWLLPPPWWSASRNWFSNLSKTTSLPAWTLTCMLSEPADPQRMPYPLPSNEFSPLKIKAATSGCCLVTLAQHWIQAHPWGWLENFRYWAWLPLFANGYLDFLTSWTQKVQIGSQTSFTLALSTGAPQACVCTSLLFTLYPQLRSQSSRELYSEVHGWHHHNWPHYKQR